MSQPFRVGVIGCGAISGAYLSMSRRFPSVAITACADAVPEAARAKAAEFGIPRACAPDELLTDPDVDLILNLTTPQSHHAVGLAALRHGKHTYSEKPLAITREQGRELLNEAARRNLHVGCAPDTFLGAGIQTARKLIDDGAIGPPLAFTAFMMGPGHESWHPNPDFYYQPGGGPMFDMGPYYLTALLNLLGPVRRLSAAASVAIPRRTITSQPLRGQTIHVRTPDHIAGTMDFEGGCVGTIVTSFATMHPTYDAAQPITIYGDRGTLRVPDPNLFDGPVHVRGPADAEWRLVDPLSPTGYGRGVGLADMVEGIRAGRPFRASAQQAFAVLDLMQGFLDSAGTGNSFAPTATYARPEPFDPAAVGFRS